MLPFPANFVKSSFLVGAFSLKEKSPTITVSSFFLFFFSWQSHSEWSTFLTILQFCAEGKLYSKGSPFQFLLFQGNIHNRTCPKGPPFGFFSALCDFFSKIFEIYRRVPPWIFLKFSVCRKRWMSLNGLFLSFSALCDLKNTFFSKKKSKKFFLKKNFFPNFSNSCSLNIFEPKIWRRLGTFPSCLNLI